MLQREIKLPDQRAPLFMEEFDNLLEYTETINRRPKVWNSNSSHKTEDPEWSGTPDWETAVDRLENGWEDPLEKFRLAFERDVRLELKQKAPRVIPSNDIVGFAPDVPRAIMGLPDSMIRAERIPVKQKTVEILYNFDVSCSVAASNMTKAGITLVQMLSNIERMGYRVKLTVTQAFQNPENDKFYHVSFVVKDYRHNVDLRKLCFPLVSPAMFRRFGFAWMENSKDCPETYGYGYPIGHRKEYYKSYKSYFETEYNCFVIDHEMIAQKAKFDADQLLVTSGIAHKVGIDG